MAFLVPLFALSLISTSALTAATLACCRCYGYGGCCECRCHHNLSAFGDRSTDHNQHRKTVTEEDAPRGTRRGNDTTRHGTQRSWDSNPTIYPDQEPRGSERSRGGGNPTSEGGEEQSRSRSESKPRSDPSNKRGPSSLKDRSGSSDTSSSHDSNDSKTSSESPNSDRSDSRSSSRSSSSKSQSSRRAPSSRGREKSNPDQSSLKRPSSDPATTSPASSPEKVAMTKEQMTELLPKIETEIKSLQSNLPKLNTPSEEPEKEKERTEAITAVSTRIDQLKDMAKQIKTVLADDSEGSTPS